jgi:hypothetical protein
VTSNFQRVLSRGGILDASVDTHQLAVLSYYSSTSLLTTLLPLQRPPLGFCPFLLITVRFSSSAPSLGSNLAKAQHGSFHSPNEWPSAAHARKHPESSVRTRAPSIVFPSIISAYRGHGVASILRGNTGQHAAAGQTRRLTIYTETPNSRGSYESCYCQLDHKWGTRICACETKTYVADYSWDKQG